MGPKQVIFMLVQLYGYIQCLKIDDKDISDVIELINKHMKCLMEWGTNRQLCQDHIQINGTELINQRVKKKKPQNGKLIEKLLLIITMANSKRFTPKNKLVIYTVTFVELDNQRNCGQIYEIYGIIELKKIRILTKDNSPNLGVHQIFELLLIIQSTHLVFKY